MASALVIVCRWSILIGDTKPIQSTADIFGRPKEKLEAHMFSNIISVDIPISAYIDLVFLELYARLDRDNECFVSRCIHDNINIKKKMHFYITSQIFF